MEQKKPNHWTSLIEMDRYDMMPVYARSGQHHEMQKGEFGAWVRYEDAASLVRSLLKDIHYLEDLLEM